MDGFARTANRATADLPPHPSHTARIHAGYGAAGGPATGRGDSGNGSGGGQRSTGTSGGAPAPGSSFASPSLATAPSIWTQDGASSGLLCDFDALSGRASTRGATTLANGSGGDAARLGNTSLRASSLSPAAKGANAVASFDRTSIPGDEYLAATSHHSTTPRHRSASPGDISHLSSSLSATPSQQDQAFPLRSPLPRRAGGSGGAAGTSSAPRGMPFSAARRSSFAPAEASSNNSSLAGSPSLLPQYISSSEHSRHSSGHGSSLTGTTSGTVAGFGGSVLGNGQVGGSNASAASSAGEPHYISGSSARSRGTLGSFGSGSSGFGGTAASVGDINGLGRPGDKAGSFSGSPTGATSGMATLTSALHRADINDFMPGPSSSTVSRASGLTGSVFNTGADVHLSSAAHSRPGIIQQSLSDGGPSSQNASADSAGRITCNGSPSTGPAQKRPVFPSSPSGEGATGLSPEGSVPVSLPTTGPLSAADPRTQLHVSNLPYRVRWQDLKDLFRRAGTVLRADVSLTPDNRSRGFGTVLFASEDDACRACDMFKGFTWQGRTLDVTIDRSGTLLGVGVGQMNSSPSLLGIPNPQATPSPIPVIRSDRQQPGISPLRPFGSASPAPGNLGPLVSPSAHQQNQSQQQMQQQHLPQIHRSTSPLPNVQSGPSPALIPFLGGGRGSTSARSTSSSSLPSNVASPATFGQRSALVHMQPSVHHLQQQQQQQQNFQNPAGGSGTNFGSARLGPRGSPMPPGAFQSGQNLPFGVQQGQQSLGMPYSSFNPAAVGHQGSAPSMPHIGPTAGPGLLPPSNTSALSPLPPMPSVSHAYYGRVLFVGNLPFHCQWQDLKDLFRAAGNIQRADVAMSAEGKSRGFGTVLFATPEDARNAVRIYHGYEYSGRTLKVHFDRFAQMHVPQVGALPASPSQYTGAFAAANTPSHVSGGGGGGASGANLPGASVFGAPHMQQQLPLHAQQMSQQQQQVQQYYNFLAQQMQCQAEHQHPHQTNVQDPFAMRQNHIAQQQQQRYDRNWSPEQPPKPPTLTQGSLPSMHSAAEESHGPGSVIADAIKDEAPVNDEESKAAEHGGEEHPTARPKDSLSGQQESTSSRQKQSSAPGAGVHPGRIALPPQGFAAPPMHGVVPFSPAQTRMNVPMTPGMPGFTFQSIAQTPPIAQHLFTPGLGGLLSPGIGSPTYGPTTPGPAFGGMINPAPGAPIHFNNGVTTPMGNMMSMTAAAPGFNPMFPPIGMSYQPSQYQQQTGHPGGGHLPQTPHWSQPRPPPLQQVQQHQRSQQGSVSAPQQQKQKRSAAQSTAPGSEAGSRTDLLAIPVEESDGAGQDGGETEEGASGDASGQPAGQGEGYPFPVVGQTGSSPVLQRRASTNTPLMTPSALGGRGGLDVKSPGWEQRRGSVAGAPGADAGSNAQGAGPVPPLSSAASIMGGLGLHDIHVSAGATTTEELARKIAQMSAEKTLRQRQQQQQQQQQTGSVAANSALDTDGPHRPTGAGNGPGKAVRTGSSSILGASLELQSDRVRSSQAPSVSTSSALIGSALDDSGSSAGSVVGDLAEERSRERINDANKR